MAGPNPLSISSLLSSDTSHFPATEKSLTPETMTETNNSKQKVLAKAPMSISSLINEPSETGETGQTEAQSKSTNKKETPNKKIAMVNNKPSVEVSKEKKKQEPTVISIDIPLSTHNDVHTEHNFAKLVEEKYGYDTQTPINKNWNFDNDGEDDDEDDDTELNGVEEGNSFIEKNDVNSGNLDDEYEEEDEIVKALQIKFRPGMSDMEKESLVLKEIHRRKMVNNKRIGKYDTGDPFIDDEELVYEEETKSNADGWFIWHGKLDVNKKKAANSAKEVVDLTEDKSKTRVPSLPGRNDRRRKETSDSPLSVVAPAAAKRLKKSTSVAKTTPKQPTESKDKDKKTEKDRSVQPAVNPTAKLESATATATATPTATDTATATASPAPSSGSKLIIGSFGF